MSLEEKLYEFVIKGYDLTIDNLKENNFSMEDIKTLLFAHIIRKDGNRYYLTNYNNFYYYGQKLVQMNRNEDALRCFEICFQINPNLNNVVLRLFLINIEFHNYMDALKYYDYIFKSDKYDNKLKIIYLYLLSMLVKVPDKYRSLLESINLIDYKDNEVYIQILNQHFALGLMKFNENYRFKYVGIDKIIIKRLLNNVINNSRMEKERIYNLIITKSYLELVKYLEYLNREHILNNYYKYTYVLAKEIINILETGEIPEVLNNPSNNVYEAINNKDYHRAIFLIIKNLKDESARSSIPNNFIYLLLQEITSLINTYQNSSDDVIPRKTNAEIMADFANISESYLVLLPSFSHNENIQIIDEFKDSNDFKRFILRRGKEEHIVILKDYVYEASERVELKQLYDEANTILVNHNYELALEKYKVILSYSGKGIRFKSKLFYTIGYLYSIISNPNYKIALDYLEVAQMITDNYEDSLYDYRSLINSVQNKLVKQNKLTRKKPE